MRILIFHGYLLRGTGSNIYNSSLARALVRLGHEVDLLCQDRDWRGPEGVTVHNPDIGRVLPVYVADTLRRLRREALPELSDAELAHYIEANVAAVRARARPDVALANHLVMGPVVLARGLAGRAPYAVKVHGSALEYTVRPQPRALPALRARGRRAARGRAGGLPPHGGEPVGGAGRRAVAAASTRASARPGWTCTPSGRGVGETCERAGAPS